MKFNKKIFLLFFVILTAIISFSGLSVKAQSITWQKVYPTPDPEYNHIDGIQIFDGGYIIVKYNYVIERGAKLLRLDEYGNEMWTRTIDTSSFPRSIQQTPEGNLIITGSTFGGSFAKGILIKTDINGNIIWKKYYPVDTADAGFRKVKILNSGDYILCGTNSNFPRKGYIVRTDSSGKLKWKKSFLNGIYRADIYDITESTDSRLYFTGPGYIGQYLKTLFGKMSSEGDIYWTKTYGSEAEGDNQYGLGIVNENNESIFISGLKTIFYSEYGHFTRIDTSGQVIFQNNYNSSQGFVSMTKFNNGYALCGLDQSTNKTNFVAVDGNGNQFLNKFYSFNTPDDYLIPKSISATMDNGFMITGITSYQGNENNLNIMCIKTDSIGNTTVSINNQNLEIPDEFLLYQNYPNPFNPVTKIKFDIASDLRREMQDVKLIVFDVLGKEIQNIVNEKLSPGSYEVEFDGSNFSSGIYFYKLITENFSVVKRMILLK
ncbi:MAG: T9SS type A sorting domain-containing protein [Bacteroidota bacterium]|nr:T9SS type A sorting domain-containing protein [Bacteroidota bacterium]